MVITQPCWCLDEQMAMFHVAARCDKCGAPMHIRNDQEFPFCWQCVVNRENAFRGRTLLTRAKMAAQGFVIEEHHEAPAVRPDDDDAEMGRFWPAGTSRG